jgi:hypothetical protein
MSEQSRGPCNSLVVTTCRAQEHFRAELAGTCAASIRRHSSTRRLGRFFAKFRTHPKLGMLTTLVLVVDSTNEQQTL